MRIILLTISFCFYGSLLTAQKAKLDTASKLQLKIYNAPDSSAYEKINHSNPANWIINSKVKVYTKKLILNVNNVQDLKIEKPNILLQYKIDSVEIMSLPQLLEKYCGLTFEKEKLLFKIDEELIRQPTNTYIATDAIKNILIDSSQNYPSLKLTSQNSFKIIEIKIYKLGENENNSASRIIIR